jgi:hypothetical protein
VYVAKTGPTNEAFAAAFCAATVAAVLALVLLRVLRLSAGLQLQVRFFCAPSATDSESGAAIAINRAAAVIAVIRRLFCPSWTWFVFQAWKMLFRRCWDDRGKPACCMRRPKMRRKTRG